MSLTPFHLAIPVKDKLRSKEFYVDLLKCEVGREGDTWIDLNLYGHQLVCHESNKVSVVHSNPVDDHDVPVPHFGVVLEMNEWKILAESLQAANVKFIIEPYVRFAGEVGEQATMFFLDPSGNALEFKGFRDIEKELFAN
ncbi:MAG: extradiol dioxygenase family protein [Candidatus Azotimanducaceae bacterium]|jgi:extradiol dioxygenase family protein